jgi:hypothetical protein
LGQGDAKGTRSGVGSALFVDDIAPESDLIVFLQGKGVKTVEAARLRSDEL